MSKGYSSFSQINNIFKANENSESELPALPSGSYELTVDGRTGELLFKKFQIGSDQLLDLPSKEFRQVVDQIEVFLTPETRQKFDYYGFLYKRSALLHGSWGTGKTCMINRIADYALKKGAVVIFNPEPEMMLHALRQVNDVQPETPVIVILEELDKLMQRHEGTLLSLLDGEVQKSNIIFLATTNYINEIPPRILRPGRFSNVVEVGFPDAACREFYLRHKLQGNLIGLDAWVEKTEGFSIDELKETVLAVKCLSQDLDEVIARLRVTKGSAVGKSFGDDEDVDCVRLTQKGLLPNHPLEVLKSLYEQKSNGRR